MEHHASRWMKLLCRETDSEGLKEVYTTKLEGLLGQYGAPVTLFHVEQSYHPMKTSRLKWSTFKKKKKLEHYQ